MSSTQSYPRCYPTQEEVIPDEIPTPDERVCIPKKTYFPVNVFWLILSYNDHSKKREFLAPMLKQLKVLKATSEDPLYRGSEILLAQLWTKTRPYPHYREDSPFGWNYPLQLGNPVDAGLPSREMMALTTEAEKEVMKKFLYGSNPQKTSCTCRPYHKKWQSCCCCNLCSDFREKGFFNILHQTIHFSLTDLKNYCRQNGIKGFSNKNKKDLYHLILKTDH